MILRLVGLSFWLLLGIQMNCILLGVGNFVPADESKYFKWKDQAMHISGLFVEWTT